MPAVQAARADESKESRLDQPAVARKRLMGLHVSQLLPLLLLGLTSDLKVPRGSHCGPILLRVMSAQWRSDFDKDNRCELRASKDIAFLAKLARGRSDDGLEIDVDFLASSHRALHIFLANEIVDPSVARSVR